MSSSALIVPPTFATSFHTQPPGRGLERLDAKLLAGIRDSSALVRLFKARASVYREAARELLAVVPAEAETYPAVEDDGHSLARGIAALRAENGAQAEAYQMVAAELDRSVVDPFERWSIGHEERIRSGQKQVHDFLTRWEAAVVQLGKAREVYTVKCAQADEADDDARLHPQRALSPLITTGGPPPEGDHSPKALMSAASEGDGVETAESESKQPNGLSSADADDEVPPGMGVAGAIKSLTHGRSKPSVAERLRALAATEGGKTADDPPSGHEKVDKGKGKEVAVPQSPKMIEIGGVTNGAREWSSFFVQAQSQLPKRSFKVPLVGIYHDVHTGAELATYFQENLVALDGSYDRAFEVCRQLAEELNVLRLLGEFGKTFYDSEDAMYIFNKDAFALHKLHDREAAESAPTTPKIKSDGVRRSGTITYLSNALTHASTYAREATAVANERFSETRQHRLRREQEAADRAYHEAVDRAEAARVAMDQAVASHLPYMQRCETERLKAASRAMLSYTAACNPLIRRLQTASEDAATIVNAIKPEQDLNATIEIYRTGAYRPMPHVFLSHEGVQDANFGIDLRRWEETRDLRPLDAGAEMPVVFKEMLAYLAAAYPAMESDKERRMTWIYDVPLSTVHRLRDRLNDAHMRKPLTPILETADAPTVAALVKLWLLELDPPIVPYAVYEDTKSLYAHSTSEETDTGERLTHLRDTLGKVPRLHLFVLDHLLSHLRSLIGATTTEEAEEVFRTKVALTLGRTIARPKLDTALSLNDKASMRFFVELLVKRDDLLPDAIALRTERESQRFEKPARKRTAPVDMRLSRSSLGLSSDGTLDAKEVQSVLERRQQHLSPPPAPPKDSQLGNPALPQITPSRSSESRTLLSAPSPPLNSTRSSSPEFVDAPSVLPPATMSPKSPVEAEIFEDPPFSPPQEESLDEGSDLPYSTPLRQSLENERDRPFAVPKSTSGQFDGRRRSFEPPTEDTPLSTDMSGLTRDTSAASLQRSTRVMMKGRGPRPLSGGIGGGSGYSPRSQRPGAH